MAQYQKEETEVPWWLIDTYECLFAVKIKGNLWMSFIDGDYRDYMKTCDNQIVNAQDVILASVQKKNHGCAKGTMPFLF